MTSGDVENPDGNRRNEKPISDRKKCLLCGMISVVACVAFAGSGVLIGIGYQNPGSVALGILGMGTVLFFATIICLVACCIWVEKRYPEDEPQPDPGRARRSTDMDSAPLLDPPARAGASVLPFNDIIIPQRPVKPAIQSDHPDPILHSSHAGDFTATAGTSNASNGKSLPELKQEEQTKDVTPRAVRPRHIKRPPSEDPPVDVRIVSQAKKDQSHQENSTISHRPENLSRASAAELQAEAESASHLTPRKDQIEECLATPGSVDITRAGHNPPSVGVNVSPQKWGKPWEKKTFGYPIPGQATSTQAPDPPTELIIVSRDRYLHKQAEAFKTTCSKDLVEAPSLALPINVKPAAPQEKDRHAQNKTAAPPNSRDIRTTTVGSSPTDTEPVFDSALKPSNRSKIPPTPEAREHNANTDLSRHAQVKPASPQSPVQHSQEAPKKDAFPADITCMTKTDHPRQFGLVSNKKANVCNSLDALKVPSTGNIARTAVEEISKSSRLVAPLRNERHISPTGARFPKTVQARGDPTDCKSTLPTPRQDGSCPEDSS